MMGWGSTAGERRQHRGAQSAAAARRRAASLNKPATPAAPGAIWTTPRLRPRSARTSRSAPQRRRCAAPPGTAARCRRRRRSTGRPTLDISRAAGGSRSSPPRPAIGFISSWSPPSTIAAAKQAATRPSPHHRRRGPFDFGMSAMWFAFKAKQHATSRPRPSPATPISHVRASSNRRGHLVARVLSNRGQTQVSSRACA